MTDLADAFIATIDARVSDILDRCTRCAKCVEVCPTARPAGIDTSEPAAIVGDVLDILRGGGDPASRGARWANACTGSGRCISACDDGINPRFMLAATRLRLNERQQANERRATGLAGFKKMSTAVKVLSRLQLPADLLASLTRAPEAASEPAPDIVMYLGCNVLKTPHIALLCLEVLARLGTRYKVFAGPAYCCGVIQYRAGDTKTSGRIGGNTVGGFARTGAHVVPDLQYPAERDCHAEYRCKLQSRACRGVHRRTDRTAPPPLRPSHKQTDCAARASGRGRRDRRRHQDSHGDPGVGVS